MRKKGAALIYVMIIMIPVTLVSFSLIGMVLTDYKILNNVVMSKQALYNSEAGIACGIKMLEAGNYNESYVGTNVEKHIFYDSANTIDDISNYSEIFISYFNGTFTINSRGYYKGFLIQKIILVNKFSREIVVLQ